MIPPNFHEMRSLKEREQIILAIENEDSGLSESVLPVPFAKWGGVHRAGIRCYQGRPVMLKARSLRHAESIVCR